MKLDFCEVFDDCTSRCKKIPKEEYLAEGKYIVIDQGQNIIAGYTNIEDGLFEDIPAIVFGDHTRIIKYVDKPFFLGADGVKLLKSKIKDANYKYLYYVLSNAKIPDTGYNRHFKWLKEISLEYKDVESQKKIVRTLDSVTKIIELRKAELNKLDNLIKARFVELFGDIIINDRLWKTDTWSNLIKIVNGKNQKSVESNDGKYVICGSGGSMGRATDYLTKENSVIVGRKGNINKPILMREKYWNVDTAFGVEPNENYICVEYLYMFCLFFDFNRLNKAVTIPSLTKVDLLNISMPIPDLHIQKKFAKFVEQVDKSKVEVQRALDEAQLLFDSLMQKYFG